jgi:putative ABC transport system permease protein
VPTPGGPDENVDFVQTVTRGYFATMGIPVVAGRAFDGRDGASSPPVVVINEAFVRLFYPERDPLGLRIRPAGTQEWLTVVGVAKDVKQSGLDANAGTELYMAYEQTPRLFPQVAATMNVVVRSRLATAALAAPVQQAVRALDSTLPVTALRTMDDVFAHSVSRPRLLAQLLSVFGAVALALAAVGTYGVLTYSVAVRRQEIGIRLVLGANARGVLSMVLSQGMALAGIGLAIGLGAAAGAAQLARSLLFGVGAADPLTLAFVAVLLLVVSFIACLLPARRATRVDPAVALRAD